MQRVLIHVDVLCPFSWKTYRWLREVELAAPVAVDVVGFSLLLRREHDDLPADRRARAEAGLRLLRVLTAVRRRHGGSASRTLYEAYEVQVKHDGVPVVEVDPAALLAALGLDAAAAAAAGDPDWDEVILDQMRTAADAYGTPVARVPLPMLVFEDGTAVAGPSWSRVPAGRRAADAYHAVRTLAAMPELIDLVRPVPDGAEPEPRPEWAAGLPVAQ